MKQHPNHFRPQVLYVSRAHRLQGWVAGCGLTLLAGCAGSPSVGASDETKGLDAAASRSEPDGRAVAGPPTKRERSIALIDQGGVMLADAGPFLLEAAGAQVVEEIALTRALKEEMKSTGTELGPDAVQEEQRRLERTLIRNAGATADDAPRLIATLRRTRGLGPRRFEGLLERNAMLRALVRPEVQVTPADVDLAYRIRYGERMRVRLILVRRFDEASAVLNRLSQGEPFERLAAELSIDQSKTRGGQLDPISLQDPAFPSAVRNTLLGMGAGQISPVVALENGYGILKVDEVLPATVRSEADQPELERMLEEEIRLVRERSAMDRLAARLMRSSAVTPLDDSLRWAWESRPASGEPTP